MKKICSPLLLFLFFCFPGVSIHAESTLQSKIDAASPYETITLENRAYNETIKISKPLTIQGDKNTKIISCGKDPVITINKENIILKDLKIEQCNDNTDQPAIFVEGDKHYISGLEVHTSYIGIKLENARDIKIENSMIVGQRRANGIDLWQSNRNLIENIKIQNARDGIYLEQSDNNTIKENTIWQSRYGIHLMYSDRTVVEKNISKENTTGAMIMGTKETSVVGNRFIYNKSNVHAQGLLLYDATKTKVLQNEIANNRVGVYVEKADHNTIMDNSISNNFIGLQFKDASANEFTQNVMMGNVNESQATQSRENNIYNNYWDASLKVDADGSGTSNIPYKADAYFLLLTQDIPEYQLFFQSPGMRILQSFIKIPDQSLLLDKEPSMRPKGVPQKGEGMAFHSNILIVSVSMLLMGSILFILGRKN
ncbi:MULTISPECIES: right-handed parallel beta-helix repeat-containing protein [Bacillus]|uniref:Parallel beta-helix n=1 Tax=Bacillus cereus HuA2-1 TaxID=1053201 RepID=J9BC25_BACCE|nr:MULTISPECIES: NosD domain-containing protein [Bacillus cereus group]EJV76526.1 parallel beta-helix [Bacillus cereus HuA2-1]EOO12665.1 parallel beta-helix [Bacillus cereus HuA2-9]